MPKQVSKVYYIPYLRRILHQDEPTNYLQKSIREISNELSSNEPSQEKTSSRLSRNKRDNNEESVEALLQLRHQRPAHINELRPSQVPKHSITKASVRISVGYNILQLK